MGILEKIVQSLTANARGIPSEELSAQYKAQIDVLGQLEDKIRRQLQNLSSAEKNTLSKLQRDFDRVQTRVTSMQGAVERWKEQHKRSVASGSSSSGFQTSGAVSAADQSQQMQLQMQEDVRITAVFMVMNEEITFGF